MGTTTKCLTSMSNLALPSPLGYDTLHLGVCLPAPCLCSNAARSLRSRILHAAPCRQHRGRCGLNQAQLGSATLGVPVPSLFGREVFPRQQVRHRRNRLETTSEPALTAPGETAAVLLLFWLNFVVCGHHRYEKPGDLPCGSTRSHGSPGKDSRLSEAAFSEGAQHFLPGKGSPASPPVSCPSCRLPHAWHGEGASPNLSRRHRWRRSHRAPIVRTAQSSLTKRPLPSSPDIRCFSG